MTAVAIAAGTKLNVDIENEDCWIKVAPSATREEIRRAYQEAEAQGLEPIPEEEEPIDYTDQGWTQWFRFSRKLMKERGMM